jgi:hypothetical protein
MSARWSSKPYCCRPGAFVRGLQEPSLLQLLQDKLASKDDIFFVTFGRWHFNNCAGLQLDTYRRSLRQLAAFYEVIAEQHFAVQTITATHVPNCAGSCLRGQQCTTGSSTCHASLAQSLNILALLILQVTTLS